MQLFILDLASRGFSPEEAAFARLGLEPTCATTLGEATLILDRSGDDHFDAALVVGDPDGVSDSALLGRLRSARSPLLFLLDRSELSRALSLLHHLDEDFLLHPLDADELVTRVVAARRRRSRPGRIEAAGLQLDTVRRTVERGGVRIDVSPREFDVLRTLVEGAGRVVSRRELLHEVWGVDFHPGTNVIEVQVSRLRSKLSRTGAPLIETLVGEGYRIDARANQVRDAV